ncbi:MAG: trans-aconitate 2-methyltransferase [Planctomycetes bacterium]|nr:trans-aconitate 2-methyltransferase [Planctomycetota bacterium]
MAWDPGQYLKFEEERTQPARDLLARVPTVRPARVADLGCGPGNSTALLAARWPAAEVEGVDLDERMLAEARARDPRTRWVRADVRNWRPAQPVDVLFSNATLQWLPDHAALWPALLAQVAPEGVLAVQMPRNYADPTHRLMAEIAAAGPWAARLAERARTVPVHPPAFYYDLLAPRVRRVELWETQYLHVLPGPDDVVEWVKGTGLRPYLAPLDEPERATFLARYRAAIAAAYPPQPDGRVLFPFRRLFVIAHK